MEEEEVRLSAIVLARDEERNIAACLERLQWADEVIVLDSGSRDHTRLLAERLGAKVYERAFDTYPRQRNAAMDLAMGDWVLFVDADERVGEELAQEIGEAIQREDFAGWWIPRQNYIFGKWIRHSGWYPDYQLRLFRWGKARYDEARPIHEVVMLDGQAGYLKNSLVHYNYDTIAQFLERQRRYAVYEAQMLQEAGVRARRRNFLGGPLREFWQRLIGWRGFLDGPYGLVLALLMAYYRILVYRELWRLQDGQRR